MGVAADRWSGDHSPTPLRRPRPGRTRGLGPGLCRGPRAIILDNPTRGIDAGAKEEVYKLIRQITAAGVCIILITDELLELIGLSHRIAVMRRGRLTAIIEAPPEHKPSEQELVTLMLAA